jgi:hypothetical protein
MPPKSNARVNTKSTGSWWIGLDRSEFVAAISRETFRMSLGARALKWKAKDESHD